MALTNREESLVTQLAPEVDKGAEVAANEELTKIGVSELAAMSAERRQLIGTKSNTLHLLHLLGTQSRKASRVIAGKDTVDSFTPVGAVMVSDVDIVVPVIDITKTPESGVLPEEVTNRKVKAGEKFMVSYLELMFLIIRDEYAGICSRNGNPRGVHLVVKMPKFWKGEAKLPTPTFNGPKGDSPKESMVAIDFLNAAGKWEAKPEYEPKFGALLRRATPKRDAGERDTTPTPHVVAMAVRKILNIQ